MVLVEYITEKRWAGCDTLRTSRWAIFLVQSKGPGHLGRNERKMGTNNVYPGNYCSRGLLSLSNGTPWSYPLVSPRIVRWTSSVYLSLFISLFYTFIFSTSFFVALKTNPQWKNKINTDFHGYKNSTPSIRITQSR